MRRTAFLLSIYVLASLGTCQSFGFCENEADITLGTFQLAEASVNQQLRELTLTNTIMLNERTLEERKWDYERYERLFRKGMVSDEYLDAVKLQVDEAALNLRSSKLNLEILKGEIDITSRQLELSCGVEKISSEEISKYADIYARKWENRLTILVPRIDITERKLELANKRLEWVEMMYSRGYRTKTDVRDAALSVFELERELAVQSGGVEIRQTFVNRLKKLI